MIKSSGSSALTVESQRIEVVDELPSSERGLTTADAAHKKANPALNYLLTLNTDQSRKKAKQILDRVAREFGYADLIACPWASMRHTDLLRIKVGMQKHQRAPATINLVLSILRGVAISAWRDNLIDDHQKETIISVQGARGKREDRGRALCRNESQQLIDSCTESDTKIGARDAAILALGVACGCRRNELACMKIRDIDKSDKSIRIIGKGNKERRIFLNIIVWEIICKWLTLRGEDGCSEIFTAIKRGDHLHVEVPLTAGAIWKIIHRRSKASGIDFAPHDLRRTYASRMLEAGADLNTVREAMGHSSVVTTQRYDKRPKDRIRSFNDKLGI